jgi:DNA-binding NtrC family response regulator
VLALNSTGKITAESFSFIISPPETFFESRNLPVHIDKPSDALDREMIYRALIEIKKDINELKSIAKMNLNSIDQTPIVEDEVIPINELEKRAIRNALVQTKWNKKLTARLLNISERTLYRKLKEYEID